MRITKSQNSKSAIVTLGRTSPWTALETPDGRDLDQERRTVREAAKAFCTRHGLGGYTIYASAARGGYTVDDVEV